MPPKNNSQKKGKKKRNETILKMSLPPQNCFIFFKYYYYYYYYSCCTSISFLPFFDSSVCFKQNHLRNKKVSEREDSSKKLLKIRCPIFLLFLLQVRVFFLHTVISQLLLSQLKAFSWASSSPPGVSCTIIPPIIPFPSFFHRHTLHTLHNKPTAEQKKGEGQSSDSSGSYSSELNLEGEERNQVKKSQRARARAKE